jgi:hypothetical protein
VTNDPKYLGVKEVAVCHVHKVTVRMIYSFGVSTEEWVAFSSVQRSNSFLA